MTAVAIRLRFEFRRRWKAWLSLAIVLALVGGGVLAAFAGSRRTNSVYQRFVGTQRAFDQFIIDFASFDPEVAAITKEQLVTLPEVDEVHAVKIFENIGEGVFSASVDPAFGVSFQVPKVIEGRMPSPASVDEFAAPVGIAETMGLRVGGHMDVRFVGAPAPPKFEPQPLPPMRLKLVGTYALPGELPPIGDVPPFMRVSLGFYERHEDDLLTTTYWLVRLNRADQLSAFRTGLERFSKGKPVIGFTHEAVSKNVKRSFALQGTALALLGGLLAAAGAAIFGQTMARQSALEGAEYPTLRALGMTRTQLTVLGIVRSAAVGIVGGSGAIAVAFFLSPLTPTGLARVAEPAPGFRFDALVVGGGGAAVAVAVFLLGLLPAWLASRRAQEGVDVALDQPLKGSALVRLIARSIRRSPSAVTGARFALEAGRGRTAVPVRSTILGSVLGLAALTMAFTFGAGLNNLLATPRLYGTTWDARVSPVGEDDPELIREAMTKVRADPATRRVAAGISSVPFLLNGIPADALSFPAEESSFLPPLLRGRMPRSDEEILVGPKTLRLTAGRIGGSVEVNALGTEAIPFRIVGVGVIPATGHTGNIGEGAFTTFSGMARIFPFAASTDVQEFMISFKPSVDRRATIARLQETLGDLLAVEPAQEPADIVNFGRNRNLPLVLAGFLAVLAAGTIGHLLVTGIARRRRDLAILKSVGFVRSQLRNTVVWQASILAGLAVVVGLPVGIAAGRWSWTSYAESLGVIPVAKIAWLPVLLAIPIAFALANLIAAWPARSAARTPAAEVLRTE
ncbi:MAG: ABC transporter permease [Actinomycetota bacterium]